ncbi:hypothetical protein PV08_11695 [Exophiala spinifera]|uniref:Major facilitator superfamily (MFS) profile domain-containing protein n=1 Tax=Exophiala spinifera TaxID=91928 RepID=A0A0D2BEX4_9EURO|nr:uncharacterized protein PV08_11695 [Exophiala spinifera]KIW09919.1 hypothetical protein PV08_11695 [Exophiala spinifera]
MGELQAMTINPATSSHAETVGGNVNEDKVSVQHADNALAFAIEHQNITWTSEEEAMVLRRIDLVILPLLFFAAIIAYSDSQAYGFAAIFGLVQDMNLFVPKIQHGEIYLDLSRYQWTAAIPTLGSVAMQYPLLLLVQHLHIGRFSGGVIIFTGLLTLLTIVCKNFADIMALRFFTGLSTLTQPLSILMTSMWWKSPEQPLRAGIYISGTALGSLIGQGIDLGAIDIKGAYTTSPWKWIYVILGPITIAFGFVMVVLFPASPMNAWFLSARHREIAVRRLLQNNTGLKARKWKWSHLREAYLDPQLYALCIYSFTFAFVNQSIGSFVGFLVTSFGYSNKRSIILSMPASAVAVVSLTTSGYLGSRFPTKRLIIATSYLIPAMVGNIMLWKSDRSNKGALLGGLYISTVVYGALVQMFALLSSNVAGYSKKTVVNATVFVFANCGAFAGPWAYKSDEAARGYPTGQISTLSLLCASAAGFVLLRLHYHRANSKKARLRDEHPEYITDPSIALADLTDKENPIFRYMT